MLIVTGIIPSGTCYTAEVQDFVVMLAAVLSAAPDSGVGKVLYIQASQPTGVPEETIWFEPTSGVAKFYGKAPGEPLPSWKTLKLGADSVATAMLQNDSVTSAKLSSDIRAQLAAAAQQNASSVVGLEEQVGGGSFGANFFLMSDGTVRASGVSKITVATVDRYKNGTGFVSASDASILPKRVGFSPPLNGDTAAKLYAMQASTFVVTAAGAVYATGLNVVGQLGLGDSVDRTVFVKIGQGFFDDSPVVELAIGTGFHTHLSCYARAANGKIYAWGHNYYGQLGLGGAVAGNTNQPASPTVIAALGTDNVQLVSANGGNGSASSTLQVAAYVLKADGTVYACGYNGDGNLGQGNTTALSSFTQIAALSGITKIAAAADATHISFYAAKSTGGDGSVWACGYNNKGQLGNGNTASVSTPASVGTFTGALVVDLKAFATTVNFSVYALLSDGTLRVWGSNANKQLGLGSGAGTANVLAPATPTVDDALANVLFVHAVRAGGSAGKISAALLTRIFTGFDGSDPQYEIYAAGSNQSGQLGIGSGMDAPDFTQALVDTTDVADVGFGGNHADATNNHAALLIRLNNGTCMACGFDAAAIGQLGVDASPASISVPAYLNI